jgi:hypothetical protein
MGNQNEGPLWVNDGPRGFAKHTSTSNPVIDGPIEASRNLHRCSLSTRKLLDCEPARQLERGRVITGAPALPCLRCAHANARLSKPYLTGGEVLLAGGRLLCASRLSIRAVRSSGSLVAL